MGDELRKLPTSKDDISPSHMEILDRVFGQEQAENMKIVCGSNLEILYAGIIFFVLNLTYTEDMIKRFYKNAENPLVMTVVKTILFVVLFFLVNNWYLAKKS
jgi:hypothetical protein